MTETIAVELELESDALVQTVLEVAQHKIEEIKGFEIKGRLTEE